LWGEIKKFAIRLFSLLLAAAHISFPEGVAIIASALDLALFPRQVFFVFSSALASNKRESPSAACTINIIFNSICEESGSLLYHWSLTSSFPLSAAAARVLLVWGKNRRIGANIFVIE
jgi:hypothetical protein